MAGIRKVPSAATPATAEPEISAKNIEVPITTIDRPPRMKPKIAEAKAISRRESDDTFMIDPARMNSGIASSGKLEAPSNMTSAVFTSICGPCTSTTAAMAVSPSATAIGTLISASANMPRSMRVMVTGAAPLPAAHRSTRRHVGAPP